MVAPDPDTDGDRCLLCERLLFADQRDAGVCGECPGSRDDNACQPCQDGQHDACTDVPCHCQCDPMTPRRTP